LWDPRTFGEPSVTPKFVAATRESLLLDSDLTYGFHNFCKPFFPLAKVLAPPETN
jgi:hypothetical protein